MALQAINIESLDGDVTIGYVGLAGQEKAVMTIGNTYLDVFDSPTADDDICRRRNE